MYNDDRFARLISSPIFAFHPDRDKPTEQLAEVRRERKSVLMLEMLWLPLVFVVGMNAFGVLLHHWHPSLDPDWVCNLLIVDLIVVAVCEFFALTSIVCYDIQLNSTKYSAYGAIERSITAAGKILFPADQEQIFTASEQTLRLITDDFLRKEAQAFKAYKLQLANIAGDVNSDLPQKVLDDTVTALQNLVAKEHDEFKATHTKLRVVGLGKENWDIYFR